MSAYEDICKERCEWCAKRVRIGKDPGSGRPIHITHVEFDPAGSTEEYELCTAPSRDVVIAEQAAALRELGEARAALGRILAASLAALSDTEEPKS